MSAIDALKALACVVLVGVLVALGVADYRAKRRCEDGGGRVERYNFRTIFVAHSCGKNCTYVVPQQVSDWRCVGASAEARPDRRALTAFLEQNAKVSR